MATLYEINRALEEAFEAAIDPETGEINEEAYAVFEKLQQDKTDKLEGIALWIKNLKADAEAYKAEKESFAQKQKYAENKAERLKAFLASVLDGQKFKTDRVTVSYRASATVEIDDMSTIPVEFTVAQEPKIDKAAIKDALKAGVAVPGAHLEEKSNIQIK